VTDPDKKTTREELKKALMGRQSQHESEGRRHQDEIKEAVKSALKEWLDEKYMTFGKWSLHGLLAMLLAGMVYLFMISNGWHK
jgi:ATP-dependent helicase/DNAse subunit B